LLTEKVLLAALPFDSRLSLESIALPYHNPLLCHPDRSEPGFPATQRETKPRMRLSLKERRMKSANAIKTYRKSGVAEGRDLQSFPPKQAFP
jgi:hypothetical protein